MRATSQEAGSPSCRRVERKTGTKAEDSAPSPNRARNRLGNRKATTKSDMAGLTPNTLAVRVSRIKPRNRLSRVKLPTLAADRMTLCFSTSSIG